MYCSGQKSDCQALIQKEEVGLKQGRRLLMMSSAVRLIPGVGLEIVGFNKMNVFGLSPTPSLGIQ